MPASRYEDGAEPGTLKCSKVSQTHGLINLPLELLQTVLSSLSTCDLLATTLVNKRLCKAAVPFLYAEIRMTWKWGNTPPITLLLRSTLDRPDLGQLVRHMQLDGEGFGPNGPDLHPPPLQSSVVPIDKASIIIRSTKILGAENWIQDLTSGVAEAAVALLIAMMPNLASLYLGPNFTVRNDHLGAMLRSALCHPQQDQGRLPGFESLRQVTFTKRYGDIRQKQDLKNNSWDVLPFFYLPNLEKLSLSLDNPIEFKWPGSPPRPARLKALELYRLRESRLVPLLSATIGLQKLKWRWYYQPDLDREVSKSNLNFDLIIQALQPIRHTLIDLCIHALSEDSMNTIDYEAPAVPIQGSLDGLSQFSSLQILSLPWVFVKGFSKSSGMQFPSLPAGLCQLGLTSDLSGNLDFEWEDEDICPLVETWVKSTASLIMVNLERIDLPVPLHWYGDNTNEKNIKRAAAGAKALGVETGLHITWRKYGNEVDDRGIY